VLETRLPQQGHEVVLAAGRRTRDLHERQQHGVDFAREEARLERDRAHAIAIERQREIVVARLRRIQRDALARHVVRREAQGQRAVLREDRHERRGELLSEAQDRGAAELVGSAVLEGARELLDPGLRGLSHGLLFRRDSRVWIGVIPVGPGFHSHAPRWKSP
jgi:hypothetical protein